MKWVRDAAGDYEGRSGEYTARLLLCEDRGPNKWKWALDRLKTTTTNPRGVLPCASASKKLLTPWRYGKRAASPSNEQARRWGRRACGFRGEPIDCLAMTTKAGRI